MKRLSTGVIALLIAAGCGLNAVAAPSDVQTQSNNGQAAVAQSMGGSMPAANFGTPPSGQIPILFNDHHVYTKPDTLKQGRVLAALVKGGTVLIPLRSMFEQMGATVAYDNASKTVTVSKPGAEVKVTVGKPQVVINGEAKPLDVPPMMYMGTVMVPIRVISEGMGAYVQWVPEKQLVVVRYNPATPPPPPSPTPVPATPAPATPAPTMAPTPTPAPAATPYKDIFIAGDYIFSPKVYNEFSPGNTGKSANYSVRGAIEFDAFNLPWMLEGDFKQFSYPHNQGIATPVGFVPGTSCQTAGAPAGDPGCVTTIGGTGQTFVPAFTARDQDFDGRFALKVADPRIYIGVGYLSRTTNYGYPRINGFGFGAEKLPDLDQQLSFYGSAWYYPNVKGNISTNVASYTLAYNVLKYQIGANYMFGNSPIFLDLGFAGENYQNKQNAPSNATYAGFYAGLGIKF